MSKPSKDEIAKALGEEQLKGAKQAGKESITSEKSEKLDELQRLVEQGLQVPGQTVFIHVSRKKHLRAKFSYLGVIDYVDLATFAQRGVMPLVQEYSGGGDYEVVVDMPGLDKRTVRFEIEGDPQQPLPLRMQGPPPLPGYNTPGGVQHPQQPQQPQQPSGGFGAMTPNPYNSPMAQQFPTMGMQYNPMMGSLNPMMNPMMNPLMQQQKSDGMSDRAFGMLENLVTEIRENSREDPENRALREEIAELRRQSERREEEQRWERERRDAEERRREDERRREEENRRRDEETRRLIDQSRADTKAMIDAIKGEIGNKPNQTTELITALSPIVAEVLPGMMSRSEEQAKTMSMLFSNTLEGMRASSDTQAKTFELLLNREGPEDKMIKVSEAVSNSMAMQVGLVGSLLQGVLAEKGDDSPAMQVVSRLIDTAGGVAEAMLGGSFEGEEDEEEGASAGTAGLERPAASRQLPAAQERARRARAQIVGRRGEAEAAPEEEVQVDVPKIEDFDTALQTIFTMIAQDGDPREIAFRLWKHAASGVQLARDWFMAPEEGSKIILIGLRERDEITVSDERIAEVATAIREFNDYLTAGHAPEGWLEEHEINARMPRGIRRPVVTTHDSDGQPDFGKPQAVDSGSGGSVSEISVINPEALTDSGEGKEEEAEEEESGAGRREASPPTVVETKVVEEAIEEDVDQGSSDDEEVEAEDVPRTP